MFLIYQRLTSPTVYPFRVTFVEQPLNKSVPVITCVIAVLLTFKSEEKKRDW